MISAPAKATIGKLAEALYFEARSEPTKCQIMVANVVMNRVVDKRWPNTITGVINQPWQFSYMHDGKPETITYSGVYSTIYYLSALVIAKAIPDLTDGANHYLNHNLSSAKWHTKMEFKGRCGDHWFYKA